MRNARRLSFIPQHREGGRLKLVLEILDDTPLLHQFDPSTNPQVNKYFHPFIPVSRLCSPSNASIHLFAALMQRRRPQQPPRSPAQCPTSTPPPSTDQNPCRPPSTHHPYPSQSPMPYPRPQRRRKPPRLLRRPNRNGSTSNPSTRV